MDTQKEEEEDKDKDEDEDGAHRGSCARGAQRRLCSVYRLQKPVFKVH